MSIVTECNSCESLSLSDNLGEECEYCGEEGECEQVEISPSYGQKGITRDMVTTVIGFVFSTDCIMRCKKAHTCEVHFELEHSASISAIEELIELFEGMNLCAEKIADERFAEGVNPYAIRVYRKREGLEY